MTRNLKYLELAQHCNLSWGVGEIKEGSCDDRRQKEDDRRTQEQEGEREESVVVGGVEPKEMDNWINVEASAILSPIRFSPLLVRSAMRYTQ